jgi:hypothetical protein
MNPYSRRSRPIGAFKEGLGRGAQAGEWENFALLSEDISECDHATHFYRRMTDFLTRKKTYRADIKRHR